MSLMNFGDIIPHRRRGEGGGVVRRVEERALPVRERVVVVGRERGVGEESATGPGGRSVHIDHRAAVSPGPPVDDDVLGLLDDWNTSLLPLPALPPITPPSETLIDPVFPISMAKTTQPDPLKSSSLSPPPHLDKPKRKLSKHQVSSSKYAPGDYTEYPDPIRSSAPSPSLSNTIPYRSYLISNSVDHRLSQGLDHPAELALQTVALGQDEAAVRAVVTAGLLPKPEGEVEKGRGEGGEGEGGEGGLDEACELVCGCLGQLLGLARSPRPEVELLSLLQFWRELNSLISKDKLPPRLRFWRNIRQTRKQETPSKCLCSPTLLVALVECLSHTPYDHTPSTNAIWEIGFSLLQKLVSSHLSSLPLHSTHLSRLLFTYFTFFDEAHDGGVARGVVHDFLQTVVKFTLSGAGREAGGGVEGVRADGKGMKGVHVLLEVLVKILEER